jgi:hypothetical protein
VVFELPALALFVIGALDDASRSLLVPRVRVALSGRCSSPGAAPLTRVCERWTER